MARTEFTKGFLFGAFIGGVTGALTALLFSPKKGEEIRSRLAHYTEYYWDELVDKIQKVLHPQTQRFQVIMNEGKLSADQLIASAKEEADKLLKEAEYLLREAKKKVQYAEQQLQTDVQKVADDGAENATETMRKDSDTRGEETQQDDTGNRT